MIDVRLVPATEPMLFKKAASRGDSRGRCCRMGELVLWVRLLLSNKKGGVDGRCSWILFFNLARSVTAGLGAQVLSPHLVALIWSAMI